MAFTDDGERWDRQVRQRPLPAPTPTPEVVDTPLRTGPDVGTGANPEPVPTGEGDGDGLPFGSWQLPSYQGPYRPTFDIGSAPQFRPDMFGGVSFDQAMQEPGFQFRLKSGTDALERSAAARGVLRTGGTLKDLVEYGQNFASSEYQNVYNRALQSYLTRYQAQRDMFAPHLAEWQAKAGAEQQGGMAAFQLPYSIWAQQMQGELQREGMMKDVILPRPPGDASAY
jgi:hypothetical protein